MRSCPDFRAFTRLSCVHQTLYVHQTFVRSCPDFCAFMIRLSCVHQTIRAFLIRLSCVHQSFHAFMSRLSSVHKAFVRSPDFCAFTRLSCVHDQTFVRSSDLSCGHVQTFVRSSDLLCVYVQTFVRISLFPDHVNLNSRQPRRAFIWVWTYRLSVWDLNLGHRNKCFQLISMFFCNLLISMEIFKPTFKLFLLLLLYKLKALSL